MTNDRQDLGDPSFEEEEIAGAARMDAKALPRAIRALLAEKSRTEPEISEGLLAWYPNGVPPIRKTLDWMTTNRFIQPVGDKVALTPEARHNNIMLDRLEKLRDRDRELAKPKEESS